MWQKILAITAVCLFAGATNISTASSPAPLRWDFSYRKLLKTNKVSKDAWLAEWVRSHKPPPINNFVKHWSYSPITAALLVDIPAPHAAGRLAYWFVRTEEAAYVWSFLDGYPEKECLAVSFSTKAYDELFATAMAWSQGDPVSSAEAESQGIPPGYYGFLSFFDGQESRQMLLTTNDFYLSKPLGEGRVLQAIQPTLTNCE